MDKNIVISLFDLTGNMVEPWADAGYACFVVDIQHPPSYDTDGVSTLRHNVLRVHWDLSTPWLCPFDKRQIAFVSAFPPCDHLAVSGARWFQGKGLRKLSQAVALFATAAEFCEWARAPYMIENPVSNISSHWRKPDHSFHPYQYTAYCADDNYTKKTCCWTGNGFVMPKPNMDVSLGEPDNRIHTCPPGPDRHNIRSMTPKGFAKACFLTNGAQQ